MLKSSLSNYSDVYILVTGTTTFVGAGETEAAGTTNVIDK